jgi:hypothetical protein
MPRVTALNLRERDDLAAIERALKSALASLPEMMVSIDEIDLVPIRAPTGFDAAIARIDVDLWEQSYRTKETLQETASRMASAFKAVVGEDRKVKVVLKPYDIEKSGWVSS